MPLVFVYGTLKAGCKYHQEMAGATFLGPCSTPAEFALNTDPWGHPAAVEGQTALEGEVYQLTEEHLAKLDVFEGEAYTRHTTATPFGNTWIYTLKSPHA